MVEFRMRKGAVTALICVLLSAAALAENSERRGYWWYEEPPAEGEEESFTLPPPPSEEELKKLKPEEVNKLLDDYRQYALMKDDLESVEWYYELQDFARRRSKTFMNRTEVVMLTRGDLNTNAEYSMTSGGREARERVKSEEINRSLATARSKVGLILLSKESCPYCPAQVNILKYFQQRHGWSVSEYDIDKRPEIGAHFGVTVTPTTIMVMRGTDKWFPVSVGVDSVPRIEENAYRALRMIEGDTSPSTFTLQRHQDGGIFDPERSIR